MEEKKRINWKKILEYAIPSGVALLLFAIILLIRGIFPFGDGTIGIIDWYWLMTPQTTYLWDILRGGASAVYSFIIGAGENMYALNVINGFLNPVFWIIAIFPRASVDQALVLVYALMFMIIAWTAYFSFKKLFPKVNKYYLMFFAIAWTFSPWIFIHSICLGWLTIIAIVPLLLLSVKYMQERGKIWPFIVLCTYCLMCSYYLTYMVLVATVVIGFVYILIVAKEKKKFASNLSFALLFSLLLSFICFWPSVTSGLGGYRFGDGLITEVLYRNFGSKLFLLIWFPLPLVFIAMYFRKHFKEDKRNAVFFAIILGILLCGLIFERINAMWHTGSYYAYPHRYSFITLFVFILMSLYYINKFDLREDFRPAQDNQIQIVLCIIAAAGYAAIAGIYAWQFYPVNMHPAWTYAIDATFTVIVVALMAFGAFAFSMRLKSNLMRDILIVCITLTSIFSISIAHFGSSGGGMGKEQIQLTYSVDTDGLEIPYRIKDKDDKFYANYQLLLNYPALSTWMSGISPSAQTYAYRYLGYNEQGVILEDDGGSLFSDMLLGVRYVLSVDADLDTAVYTKLNGFEYDGGNIYLYKLNFTLPFVQIVDKDVDIAELNKDDIVAAQNEIYQKFYGKTGNIIDKIDFAQEETDDGKLKITVTASGLGNLYYNCKGVNGLVDLGVVSAGTHEFIIEAEDYTDLYVAGIDIVALQDLSGEVSNNFADFEETNTGFKFTVTAGAGRKAFIPATYLTGVTAKINGEAVAADRVLTSFIAVNLADGENNIELVFTPQSFNMGFIVTMATLAVLLILFVLNIFFKLTDRKWVQYIGMGIGGLIFAAVAFLVFIKPFILTFTDIF
jgi:uncharacterized membrane protein YfhO